MAKDVDAGEIVVVSSIRAGMKREFAMMMKAQSEMGEISMGRTRMTRSQNSSSSTRGNVGSGVKADSKGKESSSKRIKKGGGEKLGIEDVEKLSDRVESCLMEVGIEVGDDLRIERVVEERSDECSMVVDLREVDVQPLCTESGVEAVQGSGTGVSLKKELKTVPTKLKDLLGTGLLEGLPVCYIRGAKARNQHTEPELRGVIRNSGILCLCKECKGEKVVTPNQFEFHAGSGNKRPPEYIYLGNGKSLRDVLNACKNECSDSLEMVIMNIVGLADSKASTRCLKCKGLILHTGDSNLLLCDTCAEAMECNSSPTRMLDGEDRDPLSSASAPVASCSQFEVPRTAGLSFKSQSQSKTHKRLTRKDLGMHRIVFADNVLMEGTTLSYVVQGEKRLEGYKENGGIFCFCCKKVVSPSQFEAHAGFASRRKPYDNIYTSSGVSLHEIALQLSSLRKSSSMENDDLCSICEDGGDLLCCDNCPRAFHPECVPLSTVPQGSWNCKYCQNMIEKAKVAKLNANAIAAGRVAGDDPLEEITQRCIRIIGIIEADVGGCSLCRGHDFSASEFNDSTVIICDQCEKEYHVGCLREHEMDDLQEVPDNEWFCCTQCRDINCTLQKMIANGEQMLPPAVLGIVQQKSEEKGLNHDPNVDIKWRLLHGKTASEDTRVWLSGAVNIFHDRFDPIADSSTGRRDLIPDLIYGRRFKDQDLGGMYCAILIANSEVVSAAIFRVFGQTVAELPLVATSSNSQGKGYFQSLFFCMERLFESLQVKDLVLPAADEAESLWKERFGFQKLSTEQLDQYTEKNQLLIFQGTSVLHKLISSSSQS